MARQNKFGSFPFAILISIIIISSMGVEGFKSLSNDKKENSIEAQKAKEYILPLPSSMPVQEYEKKLYAFIQSRKYDTELHWAVDKMVRDTGPYINGKYYGTHPAVRIFYSPKMMYWLTGDPDFWTEGKKSGAAIKRNPREGSIPDGAMIVKEMFSPPAAKYENWSDAQLASYLSTKDAPGWTVMVKDSAGSKDGWFWSSVYAGETTDSGVYPFSFPNSGFGQPCIRCHATAEKEVTFSSLSNIKGFPGDPITFFVDDTWRKLSVHQYPFDYQHGRPLMAPPPPLKVVETNDDFIRTFTSIDPVKYSHVKKFPSEYYDRVVAGPHGAEQFISSDQCMMCHAGGASNYGNYGPVMFLETGPNAGDGINVSPYGEWRWSPMGLAGRDPVFHAQIESEISMLQAEFPKDTAKFFAQQTVNTCLLCHGAMGKRQYDIDQGVGNNYWDKKADFKLDWYYLPVKSSNEDKPLVKFAGLARDGISCNVCHHMTQEYKDIKGFLNNNITGQFKMGKADELYGPFVDSTISILPMNHTFGIKPVYNQYIKSSRLCGSCHTIDLPVVDYPISNPPALPHHAGYDSTLNIPDKNPNFANFKHSIEQATYLEWLNSKYQDEYTPFNKDAQSCQGCHMPIDYHSIDGKISIDTLKTKIAFVEDQTYPEADHRAYLDSINVRFREKDFRRHQFQGLNVFLAEMFSQFNDILGVNQTNYETGTNDLKTSIDNFVMQARKKTATIEIMNFNAKESEVSADVKVTNNTGHRFPSGVGFRRAFIDFQVIDDSDGRNLVIWESGRTNNVGVIVDPDGNILPSEFLTPYEKDGKKSQYFQPHWDVIDSQDKVQIYEELSKNANGEFTTSFIHRDYEEKDNRILPAGWTSKGPSSQIPKAFIEATYPGPIASKDPEYKNGSGTDIVHYRIKLPKSVDPKHIIVRATLYYQEWAPYFLHQRFTNVPAGPEGEARRRLFYLASNLNVKDTPIEDWKLKLVSDYYPKSSQ